jgi:hypothetical protein
MPDFISKLQYKNYEKGEFSDEKVRGLTETIQLIKNFPWTEQRGVDVQLTGPSVTIQNEYAEYLKLGLFFNGKFCLYYYDRNDHLFELHEPTLDAACDIVTDFFNGCLNEGTFDRHFFNIGSKSHFENGLFEYQVNKLWMTIYMVLAFSFACLFFVFLVAFFYIKDMPEPFVILPLSIELLCWPTFIFMIRMYLKTKDMFLYISSGKADFQFWHDGILNDYNKEDVVQLNTYGQTSRSSRIFNLMELVFKDGTTLIVPGILIDPLTFALKFPSLTVNYKDGYYLFSKFFWNYTQ